MRLYIAGPISAVPDLNYPAFTAAAEAWRTEGWDVLNPVERFGGRSDLPYVVYINHSMLDVICCDAVAVLPGWEKSVGAALEAHYARAVGKPVYLAEHPARSGSSGLRPATGDLWSSFGRLPADSPAVDGVPGAAVPAGGDERGRADADDAAEDGAADGVAGAPGQLRGPGGLRGDVREGDANRPIDSWYAICRRCVRPLSEHPPFGSAVDQFSCEEFLP